MTFQRIEILKTSIGHTVIIDDLFADGLTKDEALGCVASALFGSGRPIFVRNYEDTIAYERACFPSATKFKNAPIALLTT